MARGAVVVDNEKEAQDYHELCKKYVLELINGPYENKIRLTFKTIYEEGNKIGCFHCGRLGDYAKALYENNEEETSKIEKEYRIQPECESCTFML